MKNITRRQFAKQTALMGAGLAVSNVFAGIEKVLNSNGIKIAIPMPIQIVIDDVGWWSGEDGSKRQEPYRTGINRNHVPADYQAIVDLGKKLGVRPQAATILCEWDRQNILRNLPTSTWMREKWDNSKWVGPSLDEAAEIIRNNRNHYELTMHGIGHEYWEDENFTRAEWADRSGQMRPLDQVELHLDYFAKLLEQNQLGAFPASFVPTAFLHGFGLTGDHKISMAAVVKKRGIRYINTPFYNMYNAEAVQFELFGVDDGVMTIDRGNDLFDWDVFGGRPSGVLTGPTCGMHWPNLLHEDPARNSEIVEAWVDFLQPYNHKLESMLAPDSDFFQNQLVHHVCTKTSSSDNNIALKFSEDKLLPERFAKSRFMLKLESGSQLMFESQNINILSDSFEKVQDKYMYVLILESMPERMSAQIKYTPAN